MSMVRIPIGSPRFITRRLACRFIRRRLPRFRLTTPSVPLNVIETYDEAANNFPGTCSGGATLSLGHAMYIELATFDILGVTDVIIDTNVLAAIGVMSPGTYTSARPSPPITSPIVR